MLAARVFLPANRFNVRMSRLVHARLFIDLLRELKKRKVSAVLARLKSRDRRRFDLNHIPAFFLVAFSWGLFLVARSGPHPQDIAHDLGPTLSIAVNQRNVFVNCALIGRAGDNGMGRGHLRKKAADYLRLARGLSSHSPTRQHLIVMAERLERQAEDIDTQVEDAAAWRDQAGNSENADPEL
jgi:hypothetical protein